MKWFSKVENLTYIVAFACKSEQKLYIMLQNNIQAVMKSKTIQCRICINKCAYDFCRTVSFWMILTSVSSDNFDNKIFTIIEIYNQLPFKTFHRMKNKLKICYLIIKII